MERTHNDKGIIELARKINIMNRKINALEHVIKHNRALTSTQVQTVAEHTHSQYLTETQIETVFDNEVATMIEGIETGRETKTADGVTSTLDMSSSSYEDIWCHVQQGATGYTSATVEVQVCDTDSATDSEWETIYTFSLSANETEYYNKRWSANYARAKLSSLVGTDITITLGATVY